MEQQPPKYALKFLRWFCRDDYIEEIEGNLYELFELEQETSIGKAKRNFYWNVLTHFRPEYIRAIARITQLINYGMLTNYLKIAWRSILKQKLYSFINIGGLAIGLTCFILIFLYIQHELSYDRFYPNADRIHRIYWKAQSLPYLGSDKYAYTTV
nr:ABC transporter permease [Saprospiraceae bacterium]